MGTTWYTSDRVPSDCRRQPHGERWVKATRSSTTITTDIGIEMSFAIHEPGRFSLRLFYGVPVVWFGLGLPLCTDGKQRGSSHLISSHVVPCKVTLVR